MKPSINAEPESASDSGPEEPLCALPPALPWQHARRVLVFAPHPDDESIGCGGLIVRLTQAGVPVRVVLVTDGSGAGGLPPEAAKMRQAEFRAALVHLGVSDHALLDFPDGGLVAGPALFAAVEREVQQYQPDWVLSPSLADAHRDHRCVARAVRRAAMAVASVQSVCEYEIWSALPVTHVLDVTDPFAQKMAALSEHATALAQMDYRNAADGLARYRALLLQPSRADGRAEGFVCTTRETAFEWPPHWGRPD